MYKITEKICAYLMDSSYDMKVPGLIADQEKPYVAQNDNAIGMINPFLVVGSNCKFIVELDISKFEDPRLTPQPKGFFLYRREELDRPDDEVLVDRKAIDRYSESEEKVDLTDCAIELPEDSDKERASQIESLESLFTLIPEIKECLDPEREKLFKFENNI